MYLGFPVGGKLLVLEGSRRSSGGSRSLSRNFWWRVGFGRGKLGLSVILARLLRRELRWSVLMRLAGEYETVVAILGGGVAGGGF